MLQGESVGRVLLIGVREEDLEHEHQKLEHVRPPFLHGPGMLEGHEAWA